MTSNSRSTDIFDLLADVMVARQQPWREQAACKSMAPTNESQAADKKAGRRYEHKFFPREAAGGIEAKSVCDRCPVRPECEADHHAQPPASQHHGVWYGTTALERDTARKESRESSTKSLQMVA